MEHTVLGALDDDTFIFLLHDRGFKCRDNGLLRNKYSSGVMRLD
jgi:hypothetical protein